MYTSHVSRRETIDTSVSMNVMQCRVHDVISIAKHHEQLTVNEQSTRVATLFISLFYFDRINPMMYASPHTSTQQRFLYNSVVRRSIMALRCQIICASGTSRSYLEIRAVALNHPEI